MKIRCDRSNLVECLTSIAGVVPANSPKPILSDFFLSTQGGSLLVEATDLDICGRALVHKVEVERDGRLALPSARLLSIIKEIPDDLVTIVSRADPPGATIEAGGYQFKILGNSPDEYPTLREPETHATVSLRRERLHDSLKRVSVAASRDPTRYQLNGVYISIEKGRVSFTATDGKRLTHDHFRLDDGIDGNHTVILPNQAVEIFLRVLSTHSLPDETVTLAFSSTHLTLKTRDHQISSNLIEGLYPNYQSVFPPEPKVRIKAQRLALLSAARSASLTTDKQTLTVLFRITPESLVMESNAKDVGESRIQIRIEAQGDGFSVEQPLDVRFNPVYFIDALRTFEEDDVVLEFTDAKRPVIFKSTGNYRHLVMPLVDKAS
jgi:DNA polymerase-3 subunit beta